MLCALISFNGALVAVVVAHAPSTDNGGKMVDWWDLFCRVVSNAKKYTECFWVLVDMNQGEDVLVGPCAFINNFNFVY